MSKDIEFIKKINNGDPASWENFVEEFSPWILYKARVWCGHDCFPAPGTACCLTELSRSLKHSSLSERGDQCGDGIDVYIWIFEELRKRIKAFSARNGSSLSTFVWSVLNSKNLYIDWLRSKYGRVI